MAYRFDTSRWITQSSALTNRFVYSELSNKSTDKLNTLITTQSNLQSAAITASRMVAEQNPELADLASAHPGTAVQQTRRPPPLGTGRRQSRAHSGQPIHLC